VNAHRRRRDALIQSVGSGPLLVRGAGLQGANPNLRYLTGLAEPRAALLLFAEGVRLETGRRYPGPSYVSGRLARQVIFLPHADALAARWGEEAGATVEGLTAAALEVDAVVGVEELEGLLLTVAGAGILHYVRGFAPTLLGDDDPDTSFVARVQRRLFGLRIEDATPRVVELRRKKDAEEVSAIERAAEVTAGALRRLFARARPGVRESELEAELTAHYRSHGATHAFDPIVAGGANALRLHYTANAGALERGKLLLVDTGACLDGYRCDVTRTVPVGGKFSERQREVYQTVRRAQQAAIAACRPGATISDVHRAAWDAIAGSGLGTGFVHGTSHHLGLETHDPGDVHRPLEPGCVITVEPGIYLPEEEIGVRIEDDVLITTEGPRVLTAAIPSAPDEVERGLG
jgi:Xaa-Pro aminopeptidase